MLEWKHRKWRLRNNWIAWDKKLIYLRFAWIWSWVSKEVIIREYSSNNVDGRKCSRFGLITEYKKSTCTEYFFWLWFPFPKQKRDQKHLESLGIMILEKAEYESAWEGMIPLQESRWILIENFVKNPLELARRKKKFIENYDNFPTDSNGHISD